MTQLTKSVVIEAALAIAHAELGTRESSNNSGKRVQQYQAATTLGGSHWPWCAAFDAFVLKAAAARVNVEIPWSNSASCDVILTDAKSRGLLHATPQVGDVMLVRATKSGGGYSTGDMIHTGIVTAVGAKTFRSIEGNTNNDGGREGVAVMEHERPISARYCFVRWIDGVTLPQVSEPKPYSAFVQWKDASPVELVTAMLGGKTFVRIAELAGAAGARLVWDAANSVVVWNNCEIGLQPRLIGGRAYFGARELCEFMDWKLGVNTEARRVAITK